MKNFNYNIYVFFIIICSSVLFAQKDIQVSQNEFEVGEELVYSVKYTFIKLGELKFKVLEKKVESDKTYYRVMVYINSDESIPFVDLHEIYESFYNIGNYSDLFKATHRTKDYFRFSEHDFDYKNNKIYVKKGTLKPYLVEIDSTCDLRHSFNDGLSLFYYARIMSGSKHKETIHCFINEQKVKTYINFYNESESIKIDAANYLINCVRLSGFADFSGVFGLNGDFEGWFTNDIYKVPVYAKLSVLLGNITVELISWRKKGWKPPKYN